MPIIRTLKESGHSYEAAQRRLLMATAHLQGDEGLPEVDEYVTPKRRRPIIESDSSSSSSSSNEDGADEDAKGDDAAVARAHRSREKKLLKNLEKEMKRKRTIVSISRPSSYKRTEIQTEKPPKPKTKKPHSSMVMIVALNESSEEADSDEESEVELTREAQEEEAFSLYRRALELQRTGEKAKAQDTYRDLLQTRFLAKVKAPESDRRSVTNTAVTLKYSTYKNLGNLAAERGDLDTAMENYLEAVILDGTDVTLWYKIGTVAVKLRHLALARVAFEQGLRCSKCHWPCLDSLCTILYAINDYVTCLYYVAQALERDKHYQKGLALRDEIYHEQPCLQRDCLDLFKHCDADVFHADVGRDGRKKFVDEARALRYDRQKLARDAPSPRIKFLQRLTEYRWKPLGERLVALYDHMTSSDPPMSLVTILDLDDYKSKMNETAGEEVVSKQDQPEACPEYVDVGSPQTELQGGEMETGGERLSSKDRDDDAAGDLEQSETENPEKSAEGEALGEAAISDGDPERETGDPPAESDVAMETGDGPEVGGGCSSSGVVAPMESSARTLKQLAEAFLKDRGIGVSSVPPDSTEEGPPMVQAAKGDVTPEVEMQQDILLPPDSTTEPPAEMADSTAPAPGPDAHTSYLQLDSNAGSSQDSVQQSGKEAGSAADSPQVAGVRKKPGRPKQNLNEDSVAMDADEGQSEKGRRGQKRRRMQRDEPAPGKRRSARVRNTTVKKKEEEETVNYGEVLRQFLPMTLLVSDDEDDGDIGVAKAVDGSMTQTDSDKIMDAIARGGDAFIAMETDDVFSLLAECRPNSGIVDVMSRYLERLVAKHDLKWPHGLSAVFLDVYRRLRKHISLPELFCCDEEEIVVRESSLMCLMAAEFNLDQCISARIGGNTPAASPATIGGHALPCTHNWGRYHDEDTMYLQELTLMQYMLPDMWPMVPARVYWLKARISLQMGMMSEAEESLERCKDSLSKEKEERKTELQEDKMAVPSPDGDGDIAMQTAEVTTERASEVNETGEGGAGAQEPMVVRVPNVKHGGTISIASVTAELESLQRCQSLEQLQRLHSSGEHAKVVGLLRPTLRTTPRLVRPDNTPERCSQLLLLCESQMALKDPKESIPCLLLTVVEVWQGVKSGGLQTYHQLWLETLNTVLSHLHKALISCEVGCLGAGVVPALRKGINAVTKIIEWSMEQAEVTKLTNATSVMPWVVLYHIIKYEEDNLAAKSLPSSVDAGGERALSPGAIPMLPSSMILLEHAHDYLGRRTWCCNFEGALLKLFIRVLSEELAKYPTDEKHPFSSQLRHMLEQCFFCLYGHPTKKTKTRHLQDHGVMEVKLEWSNCRYIFDYFKPKVLPEFDSYKTSSMSSELEGLLLKISRVIPPDAKPPNALESLQAYVDGTSDKTPALPNAYVVSSAVTQELYYLLADYYFKNKEFGKAIKFYLHDLCVSPNRLDSWAGMALARTGRLDLKLNNSVDSKTEGPILKPGAQALRCFQRALEIEPTNYSLWIEYGSEAYILHSHACRQIKQREQLNVGEDEARSLATKQREMLGVADHCFRQASVCEGEGDEEWLVHYMLGKVAEKRGEVGTCLGHYLKASFHLHESEARYPKKITYHNPPDLSLEALEMYFRIHAAILKLVECSEPGSKVKPDVYQSIEGLVLEASQLPFVRAEEKKRDPSSEHSTDTEQESKSRLSKPDTPTSYFAKRSGSPLYIATPQDHDYLQDKYRRSRSRGSSLEEITTDTASESELFSGDESLSSCPSINRSTITLRSVPAPSAGNERRGSIPSTATTPTDLGPPGPGAAERKGDGGRAGMVVQGADTPTEGKPDMEIDLSTVADATRGKMSHVDCRGERSDVPCIVVSEPSPENRDDDKLREEPPSVTSDDKLKEEPPSVTSDDKLKEEPSSVTSDDKLKEEPSSVTSDVKVNGHTSEERDDVNTPKDREVKPSCGFEGGKPTTVSEMSETNTGEGPGVAMETGEDDDDDVEERNEEGSGAMKEVKGEPGADTGRERERDPELVLKDPDSGEGQDGTTEHQMDDKDEGNLDAENTGILEMRDSVSRSDEGEWDMVQEDTKGDKGEDGEKMDVEDDVERREQIMCKLIVSGEDKADDDKSEGVDIRRKAHFVGLHDKKELADEGSVDELCGSSEEEEGRDVAVDDVTEHPSHEERGKAVRPGEEVKPETSDEGDEESKMEVETGSNANEEPDDSAAGDGQSEGLEKEKDIDGPDATASSEAVGENPTGGTEEKTAGDQVVGGKDHKEGRIMGSGKDEEQSSGEARATEGETIEGSGAPSTEAQEGGSSACEQKERPASADDGAQGLGSKEEEGVHEKTRERHIKLIDACLGAMKLCLQRFPQHYKAAYRLAFLYAYTPSHKNLAWSRDILITGGSVANPAKSPSDHMVAPGLFYEQHKNKNLFQGIWRIPIQDIDRSGSFPWHMYRSVSLLLYILKELGDYAILMQVAFKLYRTPEQGKKYLRDVDRLYLARTAFDSYVAAVQQHTVTPSQAEGDCLALVLSAYRCVQITQVKLPSNTVLASKLLASAYRALKGHTIESEPSVIEQAMRFCAHHTAFHKPPITPTYGDILPSRAFQRDFPPGSASRFGPYTESRRIAGYILSSGSDLSGKEDEPKEERRTDAPVGERKTEDGKGMEMEAVGEAGREKRSQTSGFVGDAKEGTTNQSKIQQRASAEPVALDQGRNNVGEDKAAVGEKDGRFPRSEDRSSGRAGAGAGSPPHGSIGEKRKFGLIESTGENIASILREAARQYEKSEALQKKMREGEVYQRRAPGGMEQPSSSGERPENISVRPTAMAAGVGPGFASMTKAPFREGMPKQGRTPTRIASVWPRVAGKHQGWGTFKQSRPHGWKASTGAQRGTGATEKPKSQSFEDVFQKFLSSSMQCSPKTSPNEAAQSHLPNITVATGVGGSRLASAQMSPHGLQGAGDALRKTANVGVNPPMIKDQITASPTDASLESPRRVQEGSAAERGSGCPGQTAATLAASPTVPSDDHPVGGDDSLITSSVNSQAQRVSEGSLLHKQRVVLSLKKDSPSSSALLVPGRPESSGMGAPTEAVEQSDISTTTTSREENRVASSQASALIE